MSNKPQDVIRMELLSLQEGRNPETMQTLPIPRTLGAAEVYLDSSITPQENVGMTLILFGAEFPKGAKLVHYVEGKNLPQEHYHPVQNIKTLLL